MKRSVAATATIMLKARAATRRKSTAASVPNGQNLRMPASSRSGSTDEASVDRKEPARLRLKHLLGHCQRRVGKPGPTEYLGKQPLARRRCGDVTHYATLH